MGVGGGVSWSVHVELNRSQNTEKTANTGNLERKTPTEKSSNLHNKKREKKFVRVGYVRRRPRSKTLDDLTLVLLICLFSAGLIDQQESLWL